MSEKEKKTNEAAAQPVPSENGTPAPTGGKTTKGKKPAPNNALKSVGLAACKRHKLDHVWVTTDGQTFPNESDAKNHARNLSNNELLKVTAK
ncbi:MAG: hypothetical protein J1E97_07315 [Muribaculaceae bacterium]|nr:hypothetical protein [Muribaculaceae bacterium]